MSEQEDTPARSDNSPPQSRSAKIRQIVSSQDSFDRYISYPVAKEGLQSPDIATGNKDHVTPDELFGPVSPSRSEGTNYRSVLDNTRKRDTRVSHREMAKDEAYNNARNGPQRPRDLHKPSLSSDTEAPLRSFSRFESVARNGPNYTDSRTNSLHTSHGNTPDHPSRSRHTDTNNTDAGNHLKTSSLNVTRNNINNFRSQLYPNNGSQNGIPTASSYNHTHILDDNLNISDSKLDTTLLRLFSRNSNIKGIYSSFDRHQGPQQNYSHSDFIGLEPVMWRVHPMTATHKETLDREMDFIAFHVQPREIISHLYKDGVLTAMDYNQLSRTEGQGDKAVTRLMVRTLQRRGSKAYPALLNALLASDYLFVCERLSHSEHDLHKGIITDRAENRWRRGDTQATPYSIHTPYRRLSPAYVTDTSSFPFESLFSSNQNETWPLTNQIHLSGHVPPQYNSMSVKHGVTPEDVIVHDLRDPGTCRLEERLDDLDAGFRLILKEIASMKTGTQPSSTEQVLPRHPTTRKSPAPEENCDQVLDSRYLEHQLADLKARLTELRDYVAGLMADGFGASRMEKGPKVTKESVSPNHKARSWRQTPPLAYNVTYHANAEEQMRELQEKLKILRRDIMALTTSTSQDSTPCRRSPQRTFGDQLDYLDTHYSHTNQYRPLNIEREKSDISYANAIPGPIPHPSFTRYPSRYSPRDPDNGRSMPRSERNIKSPGDGLKATGTRNTDNRNSKSRKNIRKDGRKSYNASDDWSFSKDEDTISREKQDFNRNQDGRPFKADNSYTGSKESYVQNADELSLRNSKSHHGNDERISRFENDGDSRRRNDDSLETSGEKRSLNEKDREPYNKQERYYFNTKDDENSNFRNKLKDSQSVATSSEDKSSQTAQPPPVPIIITPDEKFSEEPAPPPRTKNTLAAPDDAQPPREKKKVRYDTNTPVPDYDRTQRFNQERPMSRAANPAHRRVDNSRGVRDNPPGNAHRPPSPTNSITSDDSQYVRLTTPTRISSPPTGLPYERVTTPYKILRNPSNRKITTYSKSSKRKY